MFTIERNDYIREKGRDGIYKARCTSVGVHIIKVHYLCKEEPVSSMFSSMPRRPSGIEIHGFINPHVRLCRREGTIGRTVSHLLPRNARRGKCTRLVHQPGTRLLVSKTVHIR